MIMDQENITLNKSTEQADMIQKKELIGEPAAPDAQTGVTSGWLDFSDASYLKGFLIAAGVTLVATNPKVREKMTEGAIRTWAAVQGGVEEFKEKIQDVRAEMSQKSAE